MAGNKDPDFSKTKAEAKPKTIKKGSASILKCTTAKTTELIKADRTKPLLCLKNLNINPLKKSSSAKGTSMTINNLK